MKSLLPLVWLPLLLAAFLGLLSVTHLRAEGLLESTVTETEPVGSGSLTLPEPGGAMLIAAAGLVCLLRRRRLGA